MNLLILATNACGYEVRLFCDGIQKNLPELRTRFATYYELREGLPALEEWIKQSQDRSLEVFFIPSEYVDEISMFYLEHSTDRLRPHTFRFFNPNIPL